MIRRLVLAVMLLAAPARAEVPALTGAQRTAAETAIDGRDHQEEAFAALVENLRGATAAPETAPIRLQPDVDALLADPDAVRGALCRIEGQRAMATPLTGAFAGTREWFIRDAQGRPFIVYVVGLDDETATQFADGDAVRIDARFYKAIDAVAADGRERRYAAFVGAYPVRLGGAPATGAGPRVLFVLGSIVAALLVIWLLVLRQARRVRRAARPGGFLPRDATDEPDEDVALPADPADALGELHRRARPGQLGVRVTEDCDTDS